MAECFVNGSGAGLDIRGFLEAFEVSSHGALETGEFVSYVNGSMTTYPGPSHGTDGNYANMDKISDNSVIVAISGYNSAMSVVVQSISGTTITKGNTFQLNKNGSPQTNPVGVVALTPTLAIAVGRTQAYLLSIAGTTLTSLSAPNVPINNLGSINLIRLSDTRALLFCTSDTDGAGNLAPRICVVSTSGSSMSVGDVLTISERTSAASLGVVVLSETLVLVYYSVYGTSNTRCYFVTVTGNTATLGTSQLLDYGLGGTTVTRLPNNEFIFANSSSIFLYRISDSSITLLSRLNITLGGTAVVVSPISQTLFFALSGSKFCYLLKNGTTLSVVQLEDRSSSINTTTGVPLLDNRVITSSAYNSTLCVLTIPKVKKSLEHKTSFGVAKEGGSPGNVIDVFLPNL